MFGDVSAWFYECLAGIAPDQEQPGFKRIVFQPYFSPGLDWVKANHQSMYGEISAAWTRKGKDIEYRITIPPNTTGKVVLPADKKIFIDGRRLSAGEGVGEISTEGKETRFILGSGNYVIGVK